MRILKWILCLYVVTGYDDGLVTINIDDAYPSYTDDCILVFEYEAPPSGITVYKPEPPRYVQEAAETLNLNFHQPDWRNHVE